MSLDASGTYTVQLQRNSNVTIDRAHLDSNMTDPGSSASGSGGGKRPRGRPLKSTLDEEESAIKRRARVRKAQQAFQTRKRAAARSLDDRLTAIQDGLEVFSTAFSTFTTALAGSIVSDAHPELLQQIRSLTEQLLALAKIALPESRHGSDAGSPDARFAESFEQEPQPQPQLQHSGTASWRSIGSTLSPGVEHLFLSDADPPPSRGSSEDDLQVGYMFADQGWGHQSPSASTQSSAMSPTSLCSAWLQGCRCSMVLQEPFLGRLELL